MGLCDLHIHSYYSDGTFSPGEILERASEKNLTAVSITDHDEVKAVKIAKFLGQKVGILVISGIELSAQFNGKDVHILGYLFNEEDKKLLIKLKEIREYREIRAKEILSRLRKNDIHIDFSFVKNIAGRGAIGRPHIAQAMLEKGSIINYKEAFIKYIGNGKPCNVPKYRLNIDEAIELLKNADGGIPVLAHPGNIGDDSIVEELLTFPFAGIEVWHPDHSTQQIKKYLSIAERKSLLTTGGSDNHGNRPTKAPIGGIIVDSTVVDSLIEYKNAHM